jgi:MscS family membrane protein
MAILAVGAFLVFMGLAYLAAFLPTWIIGLTLSRRYDEMGRQTGKFITGPMRVLLWVALGYVGIHIIGPSATLRAVNRAGTLMIIAVAWALLRLIDVTFYWWRERLLKAGQDAASVMLQPVRTFSKIIIVFFFALLWFDNIGFDVSTLLAVH